MQRRLIALVTIPFILLSFTQTPSKKETQDWIKEKIELYAFDDGRTMHKYIITYSGDKLFLHHTLDLDIGGHVSSITIVPLKELMPITFSEKTNTIWLRLKLKGGLNNIVKNTTSLGKTSRTSSVDIILSKNIDDDELRPRLKKAFNHLIVLSGGDLAKQSF